MLVLLTQSDILKLAQIVREETGNQVQEKNFPMLESRMRSHVLKLGIKSMEEYWKYFQSNEKTERELILSLMTTHYTFFFREYAHFEMLENWIHEEASVLKKRFETSKQPLRVWSAACSRGHEVYSLAMFLDVLCAKYGLPFEILGTDIDSESVSIAKNGVYPLKEVNTIPQMYLSKYWRKGTGSIKNFAAVNPSLKEKTSFQALNLFDLVKTPVTNKFDIIFCRNVFIYFSEEDVKKIATQLGERLESRGLFVSGMSEPLRFDGWGFKTIGPSCYQRAHESTVNAHQSRDPKLPVVAPAEVAAKYSVLCVDDSHTIQVLLKKIFSSDPLCKSVDVAVNGNDARSKLNEKKYDLITLDIHMPEVNGIEFLETLYQRHSDPPVLMVSSVNRTDIELATKSISLGAFDYIEKPAMNNIAKSTDEILTKAKMAIRSKEQVIEKISADFDHSIGEKIVVPDASQCLRVVIASAKSKTQIEQVVRGQDNEHRSPALLLLWKDQERIESDLLQWTQRQVHVLRDAKQTLRPNQIYVATEEVHSEILKSVKAKSISLQILDKSAVDLSSFKSHQAVQILIEESISDFAPTVERNSGVKVSDMTPATSFPSLSVEFFANIRKIAA